MSNLISLASAGNTPDTFPIATLTPSDSSTTLTQVGFALLTGSALSLFLASASNGQSEQSDLPPTPPDSSLGSSVQHQANRQKVESLVKTVTPEYDAPKFTTRQNLAAQNLVSERVNLRKNYGFNEVWPESAGPTVVRPPSLLPPIPPPPPLPTDINQTLSPPVTPTAKPLLPPPPPVISSPQSQPSATVPQTSQAQSQPLRAELPPSETPPSFSPSQATIAPPVLTQAPVAEPVAEPVLSTPVKPTAPTPITSAELHQAKDPENLDTPAEELEVIAKVVQSPIPQESFSEMMNEDLGLKKHYEARYERLRSGQIATENSAVPATHVLIHQVPSEDSGIDHSLVQVQYVTNADSADLEQGTTTDLVLEESLILPDPGIEALIPRVEPKLDHEQGLPVAEPSSPTWLKPEFSTPRPIEL